MAKDPANIKIVVTSLKKKIYPVENKWIYPDGIYPDEQILIILIIVLGYLSKKKKTHLP
jgi:hypothetical protein